MNRDAALATAAVGVVAVALLAVLAVPGVLADPAEEVTRPGPVDVTEMNIGYDDAAVRGETVTLGVETRMRHRGDPTPNVTLLVRAVDADSGLVATTETVDVGTLEDDGETAVGTNLTVEREGGYRIEAVLFRDDERVDEASKTVRGLEALTPAYARTTVAFSDREALPPLSFSVAEGGGNRTTLDLAASLTNAGDSPSEDLAVTFVLRQADSNVVAARTTSDVGAIRPGRTTTTTASATVPAGYNYYLDAVLTKDGVVVDTARAAANLDPTRRIAVNETEEEVEFRVEDFESGGAEGGRSTEMPEATAAGETDGGAAGFGVGVAAVALLAAALLARRRER
ncbi:PGF-CTERM sorting domain-containing protein [Halogeometricum sp. S1BR25-6]|uniref:PGF-CTERM sorting domain-containing protein n=1 Tax=Halogeometricum salsisoli TaxID=2950536 RepID=A0ABU2GFM2_9EURY|nr:PGF-CTERM sorting domain-containing protein [Halogeometricum sp. S1BR25-6]MDS0299602.1 PGF-CTERM sorting domain-containing protein [Halogeometricum sp. S1BR25-6]